MCGDARHRVANGGFIPCLDGAAAISSPKGVAVAAATARSAGSRAGAAATGWNAPEKCETVSST